MIIIDKNLYDLIRLNRFVSWLALRFGEARGYPCANGLACWEHGNLHREDPTCATNTFWLSNISWIPKTLVSKNIRKSVWKRGLFFVFFFRWGTIPFTWGGRWFDLATDLWRSRRRIELNQRFVCLTNFVAIFDSPRQAETRELDTKMVCFLAFSFPLWTLKWQCVCQNSPAMFFCLCVFFQPWKIWCSMWCFWKEVWSGDTQLFWGVWWKSREGSSPFWHLYSYHPGGNPGLCRKRDLVEFPTASSKFL